MKQIKTHTEMIKLLQEEYPHGWFKDGGEFNSEQGGTVWSGGESWYDEDKNVALIESYSHLFQLKGEYIDDIHRDLFDFCEERGWYWESHDCATYFLYKNEEVSNGDK